ncbi:hypothetical protein ACFW16_34965 [Inquilinus sp. NPDC058860]|uniref:hypothetical protein n=1 Tax=Inquilinus sp. NPDC058860 TaxID=3346652 RepID=UPI0036CCADD6
MVVDHQLGKDLMSALVDFCNVILLDWISNWSLVAAFWMKASVRDCPGIDVVDVVWAKVAGPASAAVAIAMANERR